MKISKWKKNRSFLREKEDLQHGLSVKMFTRSMDSKDLDSSDLSRLARTQVEVTTSGSLDLNFTGKSQAENGLKQVLFSH